MTLSELHQATQDFLEGDWLLMLTANPWFWLAVMCLLCVVVYDRFIRQVPRWLANPCAVLVFGYGVLMMMHMLPVHEAWVRAHSETARKAAVHMNWAKTNPAEFTRFDALRLLRAMEEDEHTANALVAKIVKAGGDAHAAEKAVMVALADVHKGK